MTFHQDKNILVILYKNKRCKKFSNQGKSNLPLNLPSWLKQKCVEDNKLSLRYKNGSQIKQVSSGEDSGRSALSLLVLDEAAFIDKIDGIWISISDTIYWWSMYHLSTPNGVGNWFHRTWMDTRRWTK